MAKTAQQAVGPVSQIDIDRRKSNRAELVVRVEYQTVDQLFSEFARNINEGGLFVETDSAPPVGSVVALQFKIPGSDEPIEVRGSVVRQTDGAGDEPQGMGIEFDTLAPEDTKRINTLVRRLRSRA